MKPINAFVLINIFPLTAIIGCKNANQTSRVANQTTSVSPEVEFAANENSFFVVGKNKEVVAQACEQLKTYGAFIAARNTLAKPAECVVSETAVELKSSFIYPAYSYEKDKFWSSYKEGIAWHADISNIIPREMWSRFREHKVYNSVCYNSAMVGSGIFPMSAYSLFEPPVNFLLGFLRPKIEKEPNGTYKFSLARDVEANSLVTKRKSWEVNANEIPQYFEIISREIANGFSSANVLCVSAGKMERASDILVKAKANFKGTVAIENSQEPIETTGGHCLNLITPSLVMEANKELPHNFTSWGRAFELYASMGKNEPMTFHYIQLDPAAVANWSKRASVLTTPQFARILDIAREFREFHENIALQPETLKMSQIRFLDLLPMGDKRPEVAAFKKYVAEKLIPALEGPEFKEFKAAFDNEAMPQSAAEAYWQTMYSDVRDWK